MGILFEQGLKYNNMRKTIAFLLLLLAVVAMLVCEAEAKKSKSKSRNKNTGVNNDFNAYNPRPPTYNQYPYKAPKKKKEKSTKKLGKAKNLKKALLASTVPLVIGYVMYQGMSNNRRFNGYPDYDDDYIYIDARNLPDRFIVNNNEYNTKVLLPVKDMWLNCLMVPKAGYLTSKEDYCSREFRRNIRPNDQFYVRSYYDELNGNRSYIINSNGNSSDNSQAAATTASITAASTADVTATAGTTMMLPAALVGDAAAYIPEANLCCVEGRSGAPSSGTSSLMALTLSLFVSLRLFSP